MTEVFADSFYWIALLNPRDDHHAIAVSTATSGRIVTSTAVLLEVMDAFSGQPTWRRSAVRFWRRMVSGSDVTVVPLDDSVLERAVGLYEARPDKAWSMTDCISFDIMRDRGIVDALTADHHFEQAGFRCVF